MESTKEKQSAKATKIEKPLNIFQRMLAVEAELQTVAKNLNVKAGASSYKAVSERDIIDAVKPLEEKYGIYSYPIDREILEAAMLENEKVYTDRNGDSTTTKTTTFFTRMKTTYAFVNVDRPEEHITMITFSEGIDTQDKGSGKAMTYADKYALMKAYKISTGDDPDQNGSEDTYYGRQNYGQQNYNRQNNQQSGQKNNQQKESNQQAKVKVITCQNCGGNITATLSKDGNLIQPEEVAEISQNRFGAPYCAKCQREITNKLKAGFAGGTNEPENQTSPV